VGGVSFDPYRLLGTARSLISHDRDSWTARRAKLNFACAQTSQIDPSDVLDDGPRQPYDLDLVANERNGHR
jgi:hypothetical protein